MRHKQKESKTFVIVLAVIITLSMVGSIFGVVLSNYQTDTIKYGKYSFTITNAGTYKAKIDGKMMEFNYYPSELERIPVDPGVKDKILNAQAVVLLFDPVASNDSLEYIDFIRYEMQSQFPVQTAFGITNESDKYIMPVLRCENATIEVPFIILNNSANTSIVFDPNNNNCIIMNARLLEVIAAKDRLAYLLNNVMES
jgi:hypothetical protein